MLIVDASCLVESLTQGGLAGAVDERMQADDDLAAPHIVDVEVFGAVRRDWGAGEMDRTAAELAIKDLEAWPGERFSHRPFLARAWELRDNVRGWDAMYVALAEALNSPLITLDRRLAAAHGPACRIELIGA